MKKPKGHKANCGCPFCKAYRKQVRKRSKPKKTKKTKRSTTGRRPSSKKKGKKRSKGWVFK